jgi:hypothetical protein
MQSRRQSSDTVSKKGSVDEGDEATVGSITCSLSEYSFEHRFETAVRAKTEYCITGPDVGSIYRTQLLPSWIATVSRLS